MYDPAIVNVKIVLTLVLSAPSTSPLPTGATSLVAGVPPAATAVQSSLCFTTFTLSPLAPVTRPLALSDEPPSVNVTPLFAPVRGSADVVNTVGATALISKASPTCT